MHKSILLLSAFSLTSYSLYAEQAQSSSSSCHTRLFFEASWLYWKANETGMSYAMVQEDVETLPELWNIGAMANPNFGWNSGFSLGMGYQIPHGNWDLSMRWTNYITTAIDAQQSPVAGSPVIYPSFIHSNAYTNEPLVSCMDASSNLRIHLNVLDLDLGSCIQTTKHLRLRPHFGVRSAWIDQTYDLLYQQLYTYDRDPITNQYYSPVQRRQVLQEYETHMLNNFWGMGIEAGFDSDWDIKWGLSVYANLSGSLLYGLFSNSHTETFEFSANDRWAQLSPLSEINTFHAGRATADMQLGLRWQRSIINSKLHLVLQGGWEQHCFFSQNQFMRFVDGLAPGLFIQNQGDLYFQGWSASTTLYF